MTSKLWNAFHAAADVKPALLRSLKALHLEYLDLYLASPAAGSSAAGHAATAEAAGEPVCHGAQGTRSKWNAIGLGWKRDKGLRHPESGNNASGHGVVQKLR